MKKLLLVFLLLPILAFQAQGQLHIKEAKFIKGDDLAYRLPGFNDSSWETVSINELWNGPQAMRSYGWYRIHFPKSAIPANGSPVVAFDLGKIDDVDETFLNGVRIGGMGRFHGDPLGYSADYQSDRRYVVRWKDLKENNVLAIRVYNENNPGGIVGDGIDIVQPSLSEGISFRIADPVPGGESLLTLMCENTFPAALKGSLHIVVKDIDTGKDVQTLDRKLSLKPRCAQSVAIPRDADRNLRLYVTYTDADGEVVHYSNSEKYILTPKAPAAPRYNGATVFGVRLGSPVILRMAFSGERPMHFDVEGLPEGLSVDSERGIITGSTVRRGDYPLTMTAQNAKGKATGKLTLKVGDAIALTPPMGWNSWNCWGLNISQEIVVATGQAFIDKGLADYGYSYVNIDDGWQADKRDVDGTILTNDKFPDMKGLGDWLHWNGLRFGIYSSPGDLTCGQFIGSLGHEKQDIETYNSWGVDYLKYDWCGYSTEYNAGVDKSRASYIWPYLHMQRYLREQPRDIFYSLCQYGMSDVWEWGAQIDANSWRTTPDIADSWESVYEIGFVKQADLHPYASPGHWNDPDMLVVGKVGGWAYSLRDTHLTPDEQYTHISLWSLLASDMLIGCDVVDIDDFTIGLLCNHEVNAVNQDALGKQARRVVDEDGIQVWMRPLEDGSYAVGIFNLNDEDRLVDWTRYRPAMGLNEVRSVRDLWRQQDLGLRDTEFFLPVHGVRLLKIQSR